MSSSQCHIYKLNEDRLVIVMPVGRCTMVVHAARVLGVGILVDGLAPIFLGEQFLDFPGVGLDTNGEFKIFLGDRVPELSHC